jgi:hypothetical protein
MSQSGFPAGASFAGIDTFAGSGDGPQRATYQAFFERGADGKLIGYIREIDQRLPTDSDDHLQAGHILADRLRFWAHGQRLARLPEPLPFLEELPEHVAAMGPIEVAYKPETL